MRITIGEQAKGAIIAAIQREADQFLDPNRHRLGGDRPQGFAKLTQPERFAIAQKGGRAAHACGRAHRWNSIEAQAAGRKGGTISRKRPKVLE